MHHLKFHIPTAWESMKKVSSYQTLMVSVTNANIIVAKKFFQTLFILFILEDCPYFILLILSFLACWFLFSPFWYFIYHLIRAKRYENRDKEPFEHKRRGGVKKIINFRSRCAFLSCWLWQFFCWLSLKLYRQHLSSYL